MSKKISKYVTALDYFNKTLIVLFGTSGEISTISFARIIGATIGIASIGLSLIFSLTTGIIKEILKIIRNKKRNIINLLC